MSTAPVINSTPSPAASGLPSGSLTELVSGILDDGQRLLKQQLEMVKAEVREDFRKTKDVTVYLGVGVTLATVGVVMALVALVHLIHEQTGWPLSASWGLMAGLMLVAGAIAFVVGRRILASYNPLPDKSANALQENAQWIANPPK